MAEIELHVLNTLCLNRRIGDLDTMSKEIKVWQRDINGKDAKINWRFTNDQARIKLKRLYPTLLNWHDNSGESKLVFFYGVKKILENITESIT